MARRNVEIEGIRYRVIEDMGFNHDTGTYSVVLNVSGCERVAIKDGRTWRFWTAADRVSVQRASRGVGQ